LAFKGLTATNYDKASVWKEWCTILRDINGTSIKKTGNVCINVPLRCVRVTNAALKSSKYYIY